MRSLTSATTMLPQMPSKRWMARPSSTEKNLWLNNQCPVEREREQDQVVMTFVSTVSEKAIGLMNAEIGEPVGTDLEAEIMVVEIMAVDIIKDTLGQDQDLTMEEEAVTIVVEADHSERIADPEI